MEALCCQIAIGNRRWRIAEETAFCLSTSMAVSSRLASYGQCPAALIPHSNGLSSTLRTYKPIYCGDTLFLRERRSGYILFAKAIE
jgi:hypothetical protein